MKVVQSRREGFALAGAVLAMVLVGAIVTGGFYAAHQESQVTRSTELADLALYIAETGLDAAMGNATATQLDGYGLNSTVTYYNGVNVQYGGRTVGNYTVTITKLTAMLFVVRSTGTVTVGQARNNSNSTRTVSNVMRLRVADFDNQTAVQVYGDLDVAGTSDIEGTDRYLSSQWSGCSTTSGSAAVSAQPGASITESGSGDIDGNVRRNNMTSADFTVFGDLTWNDVVRMATVTLPGGTDLSQIDPSYTNGQCNTSDPRNWGAPEDRNDACFTHFPIVHAQGDLSISANDDGQGILLVEGDLRITSQFEFYGPIIVLGTIDFAGGSNVYGSVFAYGGGTLGATNNTSGNMIVQYSSCSIKRAVMGASGLSRGVPIRNRSWMDLTAIQNSY